MKYNHVQFILLAEFDIDKGSSLTYQYPAPTGTDPHVLAELMLPDGAHQWEDDWTIFFLNQKVPESGKSLENGSESAKQNPNHQPLLYVLNRVCTKHDPGAPRGAMVKAMAICTKHQYLHVYKPVLLLALENYFQNPSQDILASLFDAVNSMDLRTMPAFSLNERLILRASENKDMFEEKFVEMEEINNPDFRDPRELEQVSGDEIDEYTMRKKKRNTYIDLSSGQKKEMTTTMSNKNKDRHFFETKVIYEGHKLPIRVPLTVHPEEVGDFSLIKLITTFSQSAASYHMTHPHLHTSGPHTHPIILLINALLTQKKIIFLGHGLPSGEVANYVLAACAMGSGSGAVLRGFTERAFPYTNLTNVDELRKFPGFIAGVTNPTFEEHPKWWDVLCNIRTGKVTVSSEINMSGVGGGTLVGKEKIGSDPTTKPGSAASHPQRFENMSDSDFMSEVMLAIQSHYGENVIRAKIQEYIQRFVRLAALYEEETRGSTSIGITDLNTESANELLGNGLYFPDMGPNSSREKELLANRGRIEGWIGTISYECYQEDFQSYLKSRSITSIDVARQIMKLKVCREMSSTEAEAIFKAFLDAVITDDQVIELLANLPQNQGGLFVLASGLYHPSKAVREFTVQLFNKIKQHKAGARFIHDLNHFHKLAYERLSRTSSSTDWSLRSISNFTN